MVYRPGRRAGSMAPSAWSASQNAEEEVRERGIIDASSFAVKNNTGGEAEVQSKFIVNPTFKSCERCFHFPPWLLGRREIRLSITVTCTRNVPQPCHHRDRDPILAY